MLTSTASDPRRPHRPRPRPLAGRRGRLPRPARAASGRRQAGPMLRSSSAATATGLAIVSRQPRLPQRQIGPCGSHEDVADLAGDAERSVVRPAGEDEAGADARPTGGRRRDRRRRGRRRTASRRARRRWRRSRAGRGCRGAPPSRRQAGCRASRGGSRSPRARRCASVDRRGETHADAEQAIAVDAGAARVRRGRAPAARSRLSVGAWSTSAGDQSSTTGWPERSQTATRMCWWPKSRPTAKRGVGDEREQDRRAAGVARPIVRRARRAPRRCRRRASSSTTVETVCRARAGVPRELSPARRRMAVDRLDHAQPVQLANAERAGASSHVGIASEILLVGFCRNSPLSGKSWRRHNGLRLI